MLGLVAAVLVVPSLSRSHGRARLDDHDDAARGPDRRHDEELRRADAAVLALDRAAGTNPTPCCLTNRVARVTLSKYNPLGVRMWSFWEEYHYGTRAGWVWTAQRFCDGTGSAAWNYNGCTLLNHWGHLGYTFVGGKAKADMASRISTPWWNIGEHHYPTISMTVYGDGHYTYTRDCGC